MTLSDNGSPVSLRIADSVVEITLNRPPANALGTADHRRAAHRARRR